MSRSLTTLRPGAPSGLTPTRRRVVQAGVWSAPAVVLATAAPAAASASSSSLSGSIEALGACTVSAQGPSPSNAHITAAWADGIVFTIQGGAPGAPVPTITFVGTFTDASSNPVDMYGEVQHSPELAFVAPSAPAFVGPSITYLYVGSSPTFDASGTFTGSLSGTLRLGNNVWGPIATLPHGGSFHLSLVVGGTTLATRNQVT